MKPPKIHTVSLSSALRRLLIELQTWCSADCCKSDAFRVSDAAIGRWLEGERIDRTRELATEIGTISRGLQHAEGRIALDVRGLESVWDVPAFQAFWERFGEAFELAITARNRNEREPQRHAEQSAAPDPAGM